MVPAAEGTAHWELTPEQWVRSSWGMATHVHPFPHQSTPSPPVSPSQCCSCVVYRRERSQPCRAEAASGKTYDCASSDTDPSRSSGPLSQLPSRMVKGKPPEEMLMCQNRRQDMLSKDHVGSLQVLQLPPTVQRTDFWYFFGDRWIFYSGILFLVFIWNHWTTTPVQSFSCQWKTIQKSEVKTVSLELPAA